VPCDGAEIVKPDRSAAAAVVSRDGEASKTLLAPVPACDPSVPPSSRSMTSPMAFVSAGAPNVRIGACAASPFVTGLRRIQPAYTAAAHRGPARVVYAMADEAASDAAAAPESVPEAPVPATEEVVAASAEVKAVDAAAGDKKRRAGGSRRAGGGKPKKEVTLQLQDMAVGQELEGVVKSTTAYGAFVGDMGTPTDGLLHVSQLAAGFVENVTDVVSVGDKINVRVLSVDIEKGNFSLTMKPPQTAEEAAASADKRSGSGARGGGGGGGGGGGSSGGPNMNAKWDAFKFDPAVFVDVKVVSVAGFGAFCKILDKDGNDDGEAPTDGLIHISEMSKEHVTEVSSVLSVGQTAKARVTAIDRKRNRISMSLKPYEAGESETLAEDMAANVGNQPEFKTTMELAFERAKAKPQS
jgi:predicted RNA-binding protein with RPS1 domain